MLSWCLSLMWRSLASLSFSIESFKADAAIWMQRNICFSHTDSRMLPTEKTPMTRCPNATHDSISPLRVFFLSFFYRVFVFSSLLGLELLTSGSAAWCFLAAVKFHSSQPSGADTFFFNHANIHARSVSEHDEALTSSLSIKAAHADIGSEGSWAETIMNQTSARETRTTPVFNTWAERVRFRNKNKTVQRASWLSLNILFANKRVITQKS